MIELLYKASLWIALFGTLTSTIFLGMVAVASLRFVRAQNRISNSG
jgi:Tfp pilus assembly protein PilX